MGWQAPQANGIIGRVDCMTIETDDLQELAAEVRGLKAQVLNWQRRRSHRERRMLELLVSLAQYVDVPPPREEPKPSGPALLEAVETMAAAKARAMRRALEATAGNKMAAARLLGVNPKTIYNLMREAGLPMSFGQGGATVRG